MALLSRRLFDSVAMVYLPGLDVSCHDRTSQEREGLSGSQRKDQTLLITVKMLFMIVGIFRPVQKAVGGGQQEE